MSVSGATLELAGSVAAADGKLLAVGTVATFAMPDDTEHTATITKIEPGKNATDRWSVTLEPAPFTAEQIQQVQGSNVRVHGLRPCDFSNGLPLQDVLLEFLQFVRGRTLVGYYLQYDIAVLNKYLRPLMGAALPNRRIEVSGWYYDWRFAQYPGAYIDLRWETMVKNLGLPTLPRHDAMNDAITAAMMYLALQPRRYGAHRLP